ncbi:acyl carrier protein [Haloferax sp. ATB1]|uniref:acyl carrier protein n=1 Tax=Haloferax sp. ATB1 TaxID=1508454 RepID=UPI0005B1EC2F|nr:phosphopantetheine-binding protein [Haloferax sp. ATB1]
MADSPSISTQIDTIVADRLRVDMDSFDDSTALKGETLDAESLDIVELAEVIEADLGVHIPDEDLAEIEQVRGFKEYVKEHV